MTKSHLKFLFILLLFSTCIISESLETSSPSETIYSKPSVITAKFVDNKLIIKSTPEIWNPYSKAFKINDSYLLNFNIVFSMNVVNNTESITYTDEVMNTLVGYTGIPSGLSKQNEFTCIYNFSYNFSNQMESGKLFKATIDIHTKAPDLIPLHSRINGTKVAIANNNLTIMTVNPSTWGVVDKSNSTPFFADIFIFTIVMIALFRRKRLKLL